MDLGGNTPLHLAARQGNTTTASTLLSLGASVNMKVRWEKYIFGSVENFGFCVDQKLRLLMDLDLCISCNLENLFLSEIQIGGWINAEIIDRFIAWLDYFCELNMNNIQIHEIISLPLSPTP